MSALPLVVVESEIIAVDGNKHNDTQTK